MVDTCRGSCETMCVRRYVFASPVIYAMYSRHRNFCTSRYKHWRLHSRPGQDRRKWKKYRNRRSYLPKWRSNFTQIGGFPSEMRRPGVNCCCVTWVNDDRSDTKELCIARIRNTPPLATGIDGEKHPVAWACNDFRWVTTGTCQSSYRY